MTSGKWLLLITNLPGANQTLRMRIWRALRAAGAASLRDGVYLLPGSGAARGVLDSQVQELETGAGTAHVISFDADSATHQQTLAALFDRTSDYAGVLQELAKYRKESTKLKEVEARRRLAGLRRTAAAIVAVDFFGGEARRQVESALDEAAANLEALHSPDEPHAVRRKIRTADPRRYRGRTWATREHLWIDRVCSAWLIRRFIDRKARFLWLKHIADCPKSAVGFDFDGAEFSHVGGSVTFEVLLQSFALEKDSGLVGLASVVHFLDVGGVPVPEAAGLAAIVTGARQLYASDSSLLDAVSPVLDNLYAAFASPRKGDSGGV